MGKTHGVANERAPMVMASHRKGRNPLDRASATSAAVPAIARAGGGFAAGWEGEMGVDEPASGGTAGFAADSVSGAEVGASAPLPGCAAVPDDTFIFTGMGTLAGGRQSVSLHAMYTT